MMSPGLRALLENILDYAGLFPPAQLPLDEAIRNYARYRTEPESWLLGRFVGPAERLHELAAYRDNLLDMGEPFSFAVLLPTSETTGRIPHWFGAWEAIKGFRKLHAGRCIVSAIEFRVSH